jgi:PKD repeat protein
MKTTILLCVLFLFSGTSLFSSENSVSIKTKSTLHFTKKTINLSDSIIFDLASATITPTYIDFPIYILSDDLITSLDFQFQFNLSKMTFSTTTDLITGDPTYFSFSGYNINNLFYTYGASTFNSIPANGSFVTKLRFMLSAPCTSLSAGDFSSVSVLLNGFSCSTRFTNLNFAQYIPIASFVKGPACLNTSTQYSNTSTLPSGFPVFLWTFATAITSTLQNPAYTYTTTGSYTTSLKVTSVNGCTNVAAMSLTVNSIPVVTVSPAGTQTVCPANPKTFSASPGAYSYLWSNGVTASTISVSGSGNFTVQVTDAGGCVANSGAAVTVINILPGDLNKDGGVDINDFLIFAQAYGTFCTCIADLNEDGFVNTTDFLLFAPDFNRTCN